LTGAGEDRAATSDLDATGDLTMLGASEKATTLYADGQEALFQLLGKDTLQIEIGPEFTP
jgi:hypothetical protein